MARSRSVLPATQTVRFFSGGSGGDNDNDDDRSGYVSDEDGREFDSDRRFSNFVLFSGCLALMGILMAANVMQMKRQKDREANEKAQL